MRFSTQIMYQQNMRGITNSQAEWMKYGEQMSTGKRVVNPSDDPIAASQAVVLSQAQAQNSQYTLARTFVHITAFIPNFFEASATPCAWFPAEHATTPWLFSSSESCEIL